MRIVMMGTGPFAVPTFRWLLTSEHDVLLLVTRPPVRRRGRKPMATNPMQEVAEEQGIDVYMPEKVNAPESISRLSELRADLLVVCDYGQILKPDVLACGRCGGINLHGSLLPRYRGAAPVQWAIYHGEKETGVSVIQMTAGLDAGPCLIQQLVEIGSTETAEQLESRLSFVGVDAVKSSIELLQHHSDCSQSPGVVQDTDNISLAPRLRKSDGEVQWSRSAHEIHCQVRAFKPWPATYTHWLPVDREPVRWILEEVSVRESMSPVSGMSPGTILESPGDEICVVTGDGVLAIHQLQPAGKRSMSAADLLRGYPIGSGARLGK